MDWLKGMNDVIGHIEENLTGSIAYETLARIVGCSVYEFSRIFSFMAGMSVSEYIRRRRLSQAVFDIQNSCDKIIDIALKYCYESPTTFARAFKELHGTTPISARMEGVALKTYPPISFVLTIKGVNEMKFRIEKRDSFQVMGLSGYESNGGDGLIDKDGWDSNLPPIWDNFLENYDPRVYKHYSAPLWQVGAYDFELVDGKTKLIIGFEYKGSKPNGVELDVKDVPAATWAVFTFNSPTGAPYVPEAWTRVITEWFPASQYKRDELVPSMEVFPGGDASSKDYQWEIWMPVLKK